jgi:CDGSH-type Zn-finger protein
VTPDTPLPKVTPLRNGPLVIEGRVRLVDADGRLLRELDRCSLCRCGHSASKPWCDGSHSRSGFQAD